MSKPAANGGRYRVAIVINDKFVSDNQSFATFNAARAHQRVVRETNKRKYDTAIIAADGAVLSYKDEEFYALTGQQP
jgi:hypothetical protein